MQINSDSKTIVKSRRSFIISGFFLLNSCAYILSGCASTTKECMSLNNGEEQMDCIYGQLFPTVVRGVIMGAFAGAVLGGAVAFATRNPYQSGLIIGTISGGVIGGFIAYYRFTLDRANNDHVRALNDVRQDIRSETLKLERLRDASSQAFNEMLVSIKNNTKAALSQHVDKIQQLRAGTIQNYQDVAAVYNQTILELLKDIRTGNRNIADTQNKIIDQLNSHFKYITDIKNDQEKTNQMLIKIRYQNG